MRARGRLPRRPAGRRRPLVRRADRRHDARIRLHPVPALARPAGRRRLEAGHASADRQGGAFDSGPPACRWRLQHLRRRALGSQRLGKGLRRLKLAGMPAAESRMSRLRDRILELGGIQAANSYVKVNLSLFDLYPRQYCPSIPPEVVLLPFEAAVPDVVVDARDRGLALHRACRQPAPAGARRVQPGRTLAARRESRFPQRQPRLHLAQLVPGDRPAAEMVGAPRIEMLCAARPWRAPGIG